MQRKKYKSTLHASITRVHSPEVALSKRDAMVIISPDEFSPVVAQDTFFKLQFFNLATSLVF